MWQCGGTPARGPRVCMSPLWAWVFYSLKWASRVLSPRCCKDDNAGKGHGMGSHTCHAGTPAPTPSAPSPVWEPPGQRRKHKISFTEPTETLGDAPLVYLGKAARPSSCSVGPGHSLVRPWTPDAHWRRQAQPIPPEQGAQMLKVETETHHGRKASWASHRLPAASLSQNSSSPFD